MEHPIIQVEKGGAAYRHGLRPGDYLLAIDGQPLLDEIDYQALSAPAHILLTLRRREGKEVRLPLHKEEGEPLGIRFGDSMALSPRCCRNKCIFCFVDQMPPGCRPSLYVKDDDWRYSLMMGNFVTLTNVDEEEFQRILDRRATPLYVSIHSTNPDLRQSMMQNRFAGDIMGKLARLGEAGIRYHCQVVVCPGHNDGLELSRTLKDLRSLAPAAASVALVPVGLTRFRQGLAPLAPFTREGARQLLEDIAPFQQECREALGTTFVFPSDEFYCLAEAPIPPEAWYEFFPQIENGVGLLRQLETQLEEAQADEESPSPAPPQRLLLVTGMSAAPHLERLVRRFAPPGVQAIVLPVVNRFFGETVTVTGLLTGGDILAQLPASPQADRLILPANTLRHERDLFLDDMHIDTFRRRAPLPVTVVEPSGLALYNALHGRNLEGE